MSPHGITGPVTKVHEIQRISFDSPNTAKFPGAQPRFPRVQFPGLLLYRTKYGWYTQFRGLQSVT